MKKTIAISLVLLGFSIAAWAEQVTVAVNGMVCSFCANGLEKKFSSVEGVESVKVDLEAKEIRLVTKAGANLSDENITRVVKEAGYSVVDKGIKRN